MTGGRFYPDWLGRDRLRGHVALAGVILGLAAKTALQTPGGLLRLPQGFENQDAQPGSMVKHIGIAADQGQLRSQGGAVPLQQLQV